MEWLINITITLFTLFLMIIIYTSNSNAFEGEKQLIENLNQGLENINSSDGLGYTPAEISILEKSYTELIDINEDFPPCEVMKLSIDMGYNPYNVIKMIYSIGKSIDLDKACMCAVELGISKSIIARSAVDAVNSLNEPIFDMDEVVQSQCLRGEEGLAYTEKSSDLKGIKNLAKPEKAFSPSSL